MAHDVLISYSSRDKLQADAICNRLESRGIRCWIAPRDVGLGEYAESIVEAIEEAKVMVLVFSANADGSHQVRREVERAVSKGTTIVPVRIEDAEMSKSFELYVSSMHWLDAITPPLEQHIDKLADELIALLAGKGAAGSPAPASPAPASPAPASPAASPSPAASAPPATSASLPAAGRTASPLSGKMPIIAGVLAVVFLGLLWVVFFSDDGGDGEEFSPASSGMAAGMGEPEATLTFVNNAAVPVEIYWVDEDGEEEAYGTVEPLDRHTQATFEGHLWVVRATEGDVALEIQVCEAEAPESSCVIDLQTGWTVAAVEFGTEGQILGAYREVGAATWIEEGPDGEARFEFGETGRDDWSVYLYDEERDVSIQIDLWADEILYSSGDDDAVALYEVLDARE